MHAHRERFYWEGSFIAYLKVTFVIGYILIFKAVGSGAAGAA